MDKSILNLLFNYKGIITHREFRAGITILFLLIVIDIIYMAIYRTTFIPIAEMGLDQQSSFVEYLNVTSSFIPSLIPSSFLLTYTAFILSYKRMRALSEKRFPAVLSGLSNYLFLASIPALLMFVISQTLDYSMYNNNRLYLTPTVVTIIALLFVIGLINIIICAKGGSNPEPTHSSKGRLDPLSYIMKLGNILGCASAFVILLTGLTLTSPILLKYPVLTSIIYRIAILITLIFYIIYTYRRVKDAGVSVAVFISVMGAYAALIATRYWMISSQHSLLFVFSTLFSTATNLLAAAQFLMFLLPSKNKESMS